MSGDASAADSAGDPSALLEFRSGETVRIRGRGLIGRAPRAEPREYVDQLVRIDDSARSLSATHLEFGWDAAGLWILDRFSANGTIVVTSGGEVLRCEPGRRMRISAGALLRLGDVELRIGEVAGLSDVRG